MRMWSKDDINTLTWIREHHAPWRKDWDPEFLAAFLNAFQILESQSNLSRESLVEWWKSTEEYKSMAPTYFPEPSPTPDPEPVTVTQFAVANTRWFNQDYREVSAFTLYSRWLRGERDHVRAYMQRCKDKGFTTLRVILTLGGPYWEHTPLGYSLACGPQIDGFYDHLVEFTQEAAKLGLHIRYVLLGDLHMFVPPHKYADLDARRDVLDGADRDAIRLYVIKTVRTLTYEPNILWEIANEYGNIGLSRSEAFIVELGQLVKREDPDALLNLSVKDGADSDKTTWVRKPADFVSAHLERWLNMWELNWIKRSGESWVIDEETQPLKMPFLSGEPVNFGDRRRDGRTGDVSPSPLAAFTYGAVSRTRQYLVNFHHDDGLWTAGWGDATDRCMDAFHAGLNALPRLNGNLWRGHWANSYFKPDVYPPEDDEATIKTFVESGKGPWRVFGTHQYAVVFPLRADIDVRSLLRPGKRIEVLAEYVYNGLKTVITKEV